MNASPASPSYSSALLQAEALENVVTKAGTDIDKHVVEVLLDKFQLGAHCGAIKRYLLLGQVGASLDVTGRIKLI